MEVTEEALAAMFAVLSLRTWTSGSGACWPASWAAQGHRVSARTVAGLLGELDYLLQAPSKQVEGAQHPDRDGQFGYLNAQAREHLAAGQPVISVDTKNRQVADNLNKIITALEEDDPGWQETADAS